MNNVFLTFYDFSPCSVSQWVEVVSLYRLIKTQLNEMLERKSRIKCTKSLIHTYLQLRKK